MSKITAELIQNAYQYINPSLERELDLRGYKISIIENLGATLDFYDAINMSNNNITKLSNFSLLKRLKTLILTNNRVQKMQDLSESLPNLENLILTNNKISGLEEIDSLAECKNLRRLSLINNLVTQNKDYRLYVISKLPWLRVLDFQKVKQKEIEEAKIKFGEVFLSKKQKAEQKVLDKREKIKLAIEKASTLEEVNRLELLLKSGELNEAIFDQNFNEYRTNTKQQQQLNSAY